MRTWALLALLACASALAGPFPSPRAAASTTAEGTRPDGALDGDPFSTAPASLWRGDASAAGWWWEVRFPEPRRIGAILQVVGDDATRFRNAPRRYVWQASADGRQWTDLPETGTRRERRCYRLHRLRTAATARALRMRILEAEGAAPALRHIELFEREDAAVPFPDWAVIVSTTTRFEPVGEGAVFLPLARACGGWEGLQAQQVWLGELDEPFLAAEPRPLCGFLSGNFRDWCEVERDPWRGVQQVLRAGRLPLWAACGGAQGLAILSETGVDREWDCPHCRDPARPRSPIYTHIRCRERRPCGDYSACEFERGPTRVRLLLRDPVFEALPREFEIVESHCGQIAWAPRGWLLLAEGGPGSKTRVQCLRVRDRPIYAAQFHIELPGTPESSRRIMAGFLAAAKAWGGYNPRARPLPAPRPW